MSLIFWLKNYQQIWQTFEGMLWLINGLIHLLFAGAVAKDCGELQKRGLKPVLVSPATWAFTALLGGVWAGGLYWILHHSTFTRVGSQPIREIKE
ncbi:MAG TPA: hypothetical protein DCZ80_07170 [Legionellales bacterium]|nr:hypothetical protein [Legionellales bacterium]